MADILTVLTEMRSGQVISDLSDKFSQILHGVLQTAGKGELTIKLKIEPTKMAAGGGVIEVGVTHKTTMKVPELPIGRATFFVDNNGELRRDDPNQAKMFEMTPLERKEMKQ